MFLLFGGTVSVSFSTSPRKVEANQEIAMSKFLKKTFALAALFAAGLVCAATTQFGDARVMAQPSGNGGALIQWTPNMPVAVVEHYVGHGQRGGFIQQISVATGKHEAMLADVAKNGGRFNLKFADGTYLMLECGGNDKTRMPIFTGLGVDCSHTDPSTGQKVGALVLK